jgi:hypothetical protein
MHWPQVTWPFYKVHVKNNIFGKVIRRLCSYTSITINYRLKIYSLIYRVAGTSSCGGTSEPTGLAKIPPHFTVRQGNKSVALKVASCFSPTRLKIPYIYTQTTKTNSVALSPRANYTDWSTATCRRNLVSTFMNRGVSCGQRGGSSTVVNLSFLDRYIHTHTHI